MCSLQVARKTYHLDSYRLPVVAMAAGFEDFPHHDAVADSEACAAIMIHAADRYGAIDLPELAAMAGVRLSTTVRPAAVA
jgi:DNA polymerase-3 subunit epsilon